jgi:4-diphosphocytidyl-2-C-methyl-D-erythritol kinase
VVRRRAPAKINLGLHVLRTRADGFHDVETVLHRIGWADTVTVAPAETLRMTCSDPALPTDERNLCMQAALRLASACDVDRGAQIHLDKRVPYGAGLGGGSSDAAATLQALVELWNLDTKTDDLHRVAATIGSDVPFFLLDAPAACATGRGDVLTPLTVDGETVRLDVPILIVVPPVSISTPDAYERVTPQDTDRPSVCTTVASGDAERWSETLINDFETPMADAYPPVEAARAVLERHGATYVSLSGSGAAVYGIFPTADQAQDARARAAAHDGFDTHLTVPNDERHDD